MRQNSGDLNGIKIVRLKEKLGTRQLPTSQLILEGSIGILISERGKGVSAIAQMVNITRLHNSISAVSCMRRVIHLARDYARQRDSFGQKLIDHPLHAATIGELEAIYRGCQDEATLLVSLLQSKCMKVVSEGVTLFGGL